MTHRPDTGDLVEAVPPYALRSGSSLYARAVVVRTSPMTLVSETGDMLWQSTLYDGCIRTIGTASQEVFKTAMNRLGQDDAMRNAGSPMRASHEYNVTMAKDDRGLWGGMLKYERGSVGPCMDKNAITVFEGTVMYARRHVLSQFDPEASEFFEEMCRCCGWDGIDPAAFDPDASKIALRLVAYGMVTGRDGKLYA